MIYTNPKNQTSDKKIIEFNWKKKKKKLDKIYKILDLLIQIVKSQNTEKTHFGYSLSEYWNFGFELFALLLFLVLHAAPLLLLLSNFSFEIVWQTVFERLWKVSRNIS